MADLIPNDDIMQNSMINALNDANIQFSATINPPTGGFATASNQTITNNGLTQIHYDLNTTLVNAVDTPYFNTSGSQTNQVMDATPAFTVSASITRAANTTAYSSGCIILGNGATTLPTLDLSSIIGANQRRIAITTAYLISSNGSNTPWQGFIDFFNVNNPSTNTGLSDGATFNPLASTLVSNFSDKIDSMSNVWTYGTIANITYQQDMIRKVMTDTAGKTYFALVNNGSYTPASGEVLTLIVKFFLLN